MRGVFVWLLCFMNVFISCEVSAAALNETKTVVVDHNLWRPVTATRPDAAVHEFINGYSKSTAKNNLLGQQGAVVASIPITNNVAGSWYVLPIANFIDTGIAFWQDEENNLTKIADFSQSHTQQTAILMHGQAFKLNLPKAGKGTLWVYLNAKHYPTPVNIHFINESTFISQQFHINALTLIGISVMLTLAAMALIMFLKTKQNVAFFCAGYIGLHGIGWACASGALSGFYASNIINLHYLGMYIFSFAIGCASAYAYCLFNFKESPKNRIGNFLKYFSVCALAIGVINLVLPFYYVFYLAHLLAAVWVVLSLVVGFSMLKLNDFRAKYFFIGNLIYSVSLMLYVAIHINFLQAKSAELVVVLALAVDCICILLSLSEWLKLKQHEFVNILHQSRYDPLTKVGNRLLLNDHLLELSGSYIIVFIDCDGVKTINDQLGHAKGDEFLVSTAQLMQSALSNKGDVYRTGGDEFIWLCKVKNNEALSSLSYEITTTLNTLHENIAEQWPQSGISFGIATSSECTNHAECLTLADERMYILKSAHKKCA